MPSVEVDMAYRGNQSVHKSIVTAISKSENELRLLSEYRAVYAIIEQFTLPMPDLEIVA